MALVPDLADRIIDENHENMLKCMLGIQQDDQHPLPDEVLDYYWVSKTAADRIGQRMEPIMLHAVAMNFTDLLKAEDEVDFHYHIEKGRVKHDDTVWVKFRNQKREGKFHGVGGDNRILVEIQGDDGGDRSFDPQKVKLDVNQLA